MATSLQVRKQELVRDAIYDAAIDLFAEKGFEEVTVEEVAQAAGVSRRSFFRYFATKDDLLAGSVVTYGTILTQAINEAPSSWSAFEVVREAVLAGARYVADEPRTRRIIKIAARSDSARRAYHSRLTELEDSLADAYARRLKGVSKDELKPRLLASTTLLIINKAIYAWFKGEYQDLHAAAKHVFLSLARFFTNEA